MSSHNWNERSKGFEAFYKLLQDCPEDLKFEIKILNIRAVRKSSDKIFEYFDQLQEMWAGSSGYSSQRLKTMTQNFDDLIHIEATDLRSFLIEYYQALKGLKGFVFAIRKRPGHEFDIGKIRAELREIFMAIHNRVHDLILKAKQRQELMVAPTILDYAKEEYESILREFDENELINRIAPSSPKKGLFDDLEDPDGI